jgi:hypothetical protein
LRSIWKRALNAEVHAALLRCGITDQAQRNVIINIKGFTTLSKDVDQAYSDCQKVERLLKGIKVSDVELQEAKSLIDQQHRRDFTGACGISPGKWQTFTLQLSWNIWGRSGRSTHWNVEDVDVDVLKALPVVEDKAGDVVLVATDADVSLEEAEVADIIALMALVLPIQLALYESGVGSFV